MNKILKQISSLSFWMLVITLSCKQEIHPLTPPKDPVTSCQAPPIEKNIIGTWKFESTYNKDNSLVTGTVTFQDNGAIIDPDSLFENRLDIGLITRKSYKPSAPSPSSSYQGNVFEVYQFTKEGKKQITYFTIVSNECKKIHLALFQSAGNKVGFILTR